MGWLAPWLRAMTVVTGNPRCEAPQFLKDIPVGDLKHQDFTCDSKYSSLVWNYENLHFYRRNDAQK